MQIANGQAPFPSVSGSGPQATSVTVAMPAAVTKAVALLTGFNVEYSNTDDHHLGQLDITVAVPPGGVSGSSVTVNVSYGLRDWSGDWDDAYDGTVFFTVVGE
ncbi:MAG: hypothetical protein P4L64_09230 [Caulobacteraceae bacterium]|nr:hypothetical protein [Caulobacteraceae bacterium]